MLYLHVSFFKASPKAISGRTSYLRVRLEFLRYPQVIPAFFNRHGFEPPQNFTFASLCSWIGHPVSGLRHTTFALFRLAFASAPYLKHLTLLRNVTRWPVLQKVRGRAHQALPLLVNIGFQVLFHSPPGVLFTFPSRYYALSVTRSYLALGDGPPCFPQDFTCPVVLWIELFQSSPFAYGAITLFGSAFQRSLARLPLTLWPVRNPDARRPRFGLFPFRSPLLRKSILSFSSFGYLDVSVPRVSLPYTMDSCMDICPLRQMGFPIRTSADQCLLATPRSFSQLTTSFIGVWCQGIHPMLFIA